MSYSKIPLNGLFTVTCAYGEPGEWKAGYHTGIDLVNDDRIIYSPTFGVIYKIGYSKDYGNYVVIADDTPDDTHYHWLCHLANVNCSEGQEVDPTVQIGIMGRTGRASGVHLHYEIRNYLNEYGKEDNPCIYMGIPNERGTYNEEDYSVNDDNQIIVEPGRNTVGERRKLAEFTYLWSEPDLSGERYDYRANTTLEILENTSENVDRVRAVVTGREAYVDINAYA